MTPPRDPHPTAQVDAVSSAGSEVLAELTGESGRRIGRQLARRYRVSPEVVEDAVSDACVAVMDRFGRPGVQPPANPGGYAYRVVQRSLIAIMRGREITVSDLEQLGDDGAKPSFPVAPGADHPPAGDLAQHELDQHDGDPLRRIAEEFAALPGGPQEWLLSAILSYITLTMHADLRPDSLPYPERGSLPAQALVWPALHLAGLHELVVADAGVAVRRTRSRRIAVVREWLDRVFAEAAARGEVSSRG